MRAVLLVLAACVGSSISSQFSSQYPQPSYQFAQNSTHVVLEVKFAAKISAPARTGVKLSDYAISNMLLSSVSGLLPFGTASPDDVDSTDSEDTEDDDGDDVNDKNPYASSFPQSPPPVPDSLVGHLSLLALDASSNGYALSLHFGGALDPQRSTVKEGSAGRVTFHLAKKTPQVSEQPVADEDAVADAAPGTALAAAAATAADKPTHRWSSVVLKSASLGAARGRLWESMQTQLDAVVGATLPKASSATGKKKKGGGGGGGGGEKKKAAEDKRDEDKHKEGGKTKDKTKRAKDEAEDESGKPPKPNGSWQENWKEKPTPQQIKPSSSWLGSFGL